MTTSWGEFHAQAATQASEIAAAAAAGERDEAVRLFTDWVRPGEDDAELRAFGLTVALSSLFRVAYGDDDPGAFFALDTEGEQDPQLLLFGRWCAAALNTDIDQLDALWQTADVDRQHVLVAHVIGAAGEAVRQLAREAEG